jgi:3-hydroxybutyryl-CoA dehydrogenase
MTTAGALPRDATVAVIGSGAMGAGIAQIAAQAGHPVRLFDTRMGTAEKARTTIAQTLQGLAAKGKLDSADAAASASRIVAVHALGDCVSAQLVVEAIVEDLAEKRALLRELEKIVPPQTILASNTSSLSVTAIAAGLRHPGRVAGMHFFNPVPLMKLVEIIAGLATDVATTDTLAATAVAWGKEPVHATSTPGFIVNRCARPFYGEALRLLAEGAADACNDRRCAARRGWFPDGCVPADGPDRQRRQLRGDAQRVGSVLLRPALCAVGAAAGARHAGFFGRKAGVGSTTTRPAAQPPPAGDTRCASVCRCRRRARRCRCS